MGINTENELNERIEEEIEERVEAELEGELEDNPRLLALVLAKATREELETALWALDAVTGEHGT
jgi:hypothetical protein